MSLTPEKAGRGNEDNLLADAVKQALDARVPQWTLQRAANFTSISTDQINRLKRGIPIETEPLLRFAIAVAEPGREIESARLFLRLSGKQEILSFMDRVEQAALSESTSPEHPAPPFSSDATSIARSFDNLPSDARDFVVKAVFYASKG